MPDRMYKWRLCRYQFHSVRGFDDCFQIRERTSGRLSQIGAVPPYTDIVILRPSGEDPCVHIGGNIFTYDDAKKLFPNTTIAENMAKKGIYALYFTYSRHMLYLYPDSYHVALKSLYYLDIPDKAQAKILQALSQWAITNDIPIHERITKTYMFALECRHHILTGKRFMACQDCGFSYDLHDDTAFSKALSNWPGVINDIYKRFKAMLFTGPINDIADLKSTTD